MGLSSSRVFDPVKDTPDLTGKVFIVTGSNSGIGFQVVRHLALKNATVYMGARSETKAAAALQKLRTDGIRVEAPELNIDDSRSEDPYVGHVKYLRLDLSDPKKAVSAAEEFKKTEKRLDVLINNAAVLLTEAKMTPVGIQESMLVNHLSPFAFTQTLLPLLEKTAQLPDSDVRIVNVASEAHEFAPKNVRYRNKEDFNRTFEEEWFGEPKRYGTTKLANILYTRELQRRFESSGIDITCLTLHPGTVSTEGNISRVKRLPKAVQGLGLGVLNLFFLTPEQGIRSSMVAAVAPYVKENPVYRGAYLQSRGQLAKTTTAAMSQSLARELWDTSVKLLAELGVDVSDKESS